MDYNFDRRLPELHYCVLLIRCCQARNLKEHNSLLHTYTLKINMAQSDSPIQSEGVFEYERIICRFVGC